MSTPSKPWNYNLGTTTTYPSVAVAQLWGGIREEYLRIRDGVGFTDSEEAVTVKPLVHRFIQMVHLLPASEGHHHSYPAGMLRHGLEVAAKALALSDARLLTQASQTPSQRHKYEPRWKIAILFAALTHDIGKLDDLVVTANGARWAAHAHILTSWIAKHAPQGYEAHWRSGRYGDHEHRSLVYAPILLPERIRTWLMAAGPEPYEAAINLLAGKRDSILAEIIVEADRFSAAEDLRRITRFGVSGGGQTHAIINAVRDWLQSAKVDGANPQLYRDSHYAWIPWTTVSTSLLPCVTHAAKAPRDVGAFIGLISPLLAYPPAAFAVAGQIDLWAVVTSQGELVNTLAIPWSALGMTARAEAQQAAPVATEASAAPPPEAEKHKAGGGDEKEQSKTESSSPELQDGPKSERAQIKPPTKKGSRSGQGIRLVQHTTATAPTSPFEALLADAGDTGLDLGAMIEAYANSLLPKDWLLVRDGLLWLLWPQIWRGATPADAISAFRKLGWIAPDPGGSLRPTRMYNEKAWLVLAEKPSQAILSRLSSAEDIVVPTSRDKDGEEKAVKASDIKAGATRRSSAPSLSSTSTRSATSRINAWLKAHPDAVNDGLIAHPQTVKIKAALNISMSVLVKKLTELGITITES